MAPHPLPPPSAEATRVLRRSKASMGIFKSAKKLATGSESAKDAFTDCEKLYDDIDEYAFMPFDMIIETCEAIDTLLAQREVRCHPRGTPVALGVACPPRSFPTQGRCERPVEGNPQLEV